MGNETLIQYLNEVLGFELTIINQYFLHAKIYQEWGMREQGDYAFSESIDETLHSNRIIDRSLALGGVPNLQDVRPMQIGHTTAEIIEADLNLGIGAESLLREAIVYCTEVGDFQSESLLQALLDREESHVSWLKQQKHQLDSDVPNAIELGLGLT